MAGRDIAIAHVAPDALNPAPYNPRSMTDKARAALKRGIKTFGMVDPIIARRSDNLVVGGHQRLHAAKELGLATVPVVYVDADDNQAAALNVLLNNPSAQGEWDFSKLSGLLSELDASGFDATLTGFDDVALEAMLSSGPQLDSAAGERVNAAAEWSGMPEFEHEDKTAYQSVVVHFKDNASVLAFAAIVGQKITPQTRFLWYPGIEIERYADKRYAPES